MSRVGKNEVKIPDGVTATVAGQKITFKGKSGTEEYTIPEAIKMTQNEKGLLFVPVNSAKKTRMLWGTTARNVANILKGMSEGFKVNLDLVGVGYRANVQGRKIVLNLGFSHDINYDLPQGVEAKAEKPTNIVLSGPSKQLLGQVAAEIRSYRPPEPYKGKGIMRDKEFVLRKEGKKK